MNPVKESNLSWWARKLDWYERIMALLALPVLGALASLAFNAMSWARDREHIDARQDQDIAILAQQRARDDLDSGALKTTLGVIDGRILEILQRMATVEALIRAKEK